MSLCTLRDLTQVAMTADYAVPAFNFFTYEDAKAIVSGAEACNSPVILMASGSCIKHLGVDLAADVIRTLAEQASVPVVAHLDHASDLDTIFKAMKKGFTSVMYDGSMLPVEQNIANTQIVCKVAHALGVSVEAEIGRVGKGEEGEDAEEILTTPEGAVFFLEKTQVDALAVAVGTRHAMQKQDAEIRFDIIDELCKVVEVPLVLHGSSGVADEHLRRISATKFGKINIGTVLRTTYINAIRDELTNSPKLKDHLKLLQTASQAVTDKVIEKIQFLGSKDRV